MSMKIAALGIIIVLMAYGLTSIDFSVSDMRAARLVENVLWEEEVVDAGWPMFRHDVRHTGCSDSKASVDNTTIWTTGEGSGAHSSPAVAYGKVFLTKWSRYLNAFDEETGNQLWSFGPVADMTTCSPAVADGVVFVGGGFRGKTVYALNESSGSVIWTYLCAGDAWASPTIIEDLVLTGCDGGAVYALNKSDGSLVWSYSVIGSVQSSPAVADGRVYVGSLDGSVYCLTQSSGEFIWSFSSGSEIYSSPAVGEGLVFIGSDNGRVYAINETTGQSVWSYLTDGSVRSSPALSKGTVLVGSSDYKLYSLNATTGVKVWSYTSGGSVPASPAVADGLVFAGSTGHEIFALNETTGTLVWHYDTSSDNFPIVEGSPAVADGLVFIASYSQLYAFASKHDIAVKSVKASKTVVGQGYPFSVNVTIENQGTTEETFNFTACMNSTVLQTINTTLANRSSTTACVPCDSTVFEKGNYTLNASADIVLGEAHPEDNTLNDGWVIVTIPGDIDGNFMVDIYDAILLAGKYNSKPTTPGWNPNADINSDNEVDIFDALILAGHYGEHYP